VQASSPSAFGILKQGLKSEGQHLYQQVAIVRQGRYEASTWVDNREDGENSATTFSLSAGEQDYVQLMSGRSAGTCGAQTSSVDTLSYQELKQHNISANTPKTNTTPQTH